MIKPPGTGRSERSVPPVAELDGFFIAYEKVANMWIIEALFGRWETKLMKPFGEIVVLCQRHTITRRARGFVIYPGGKRVEITRSVALEHIENYGGPRYDR